MAQFWLHPEQQNIFHSPAETVQALLDISTLGMFHLGPLHFPVRQKQLSNFHCQADPLSFNRPNQSICEAQPASEDSRSFTADLFEDIYCESSPWSTSFHPCLALLNSFTWAQLFSWSSVSFGLLFLRGTLYSLYQLSVDSFSLSSPVYLSCFWLRVLLAPSYLLNAVHETMQQGSILVTATGRASHSGRYSLESYNQPPIRPSYMSLVANTESSHYLTWDYYYRWLWLTLIESCWTHPPANICSCPFCTTFYFWCIVNMTSLLDPTTTERFSKVKEMVVSTRKWMPKSNAPTM